ncbi:hypothetical protein I6J22_05130 [Corynebacterium kroppenstedtii]|uniref:Uncharacterized protein n=1 Tax=Corynebacterium kroppenstedtii (strain DSM 44385 / JCM 11950 / CIP 105744 / CCUG 35717) TaxID=645127 RepID=C4LGV3_CORK4|nr:hypothetical protein [Corynebacterium kroppenstedtii]ACR17058.1 hypothetical protein ckrop_0272 [Corynebacterium kroppenstedtii DSM 44385]QRP11419.1 hypothetical protein I6J22_05130 [Corynebacterium kroppenstedtii]
MSTTPSDPTSQSDSEGYSTQPNDQFSTENRPNSGSSFEQRRAEEQRHGQEQRVEGTQPPREERGQDTTESSSSRSSSTNAPIDAEFSDVPTARDVLPENDSLSEDRAFDEPQAHEDQSHETQSHGVDSHNPDTKSGFSTNGAAGFPVITPEMMREANGHTTSSADGSAESDAPAQTNHSAQPDSAQQDSGRHQDGAISSPTTGKSTNGKPSTVTSDAYNPSPNTTTHGSRPVGNAFQAQPQNSSAGKSSGQGSVGKEKSNQDRQVPSAPNRSENTADDKTPHTAAQGSAAASGSSVSGRSAGSRGASDGSKKAANVQADTGHSNDQTDADQESTENSRKEKFKNWIATTPAKALVFVVAVLILAALFGAIWMANNDNFTVGSSEKTSTAPSEDNQADQPQQNFPTPGGKTIKGSIGQNIDLDARQVQICGSSTGEYTRSAIPVGWDCSVADTARQVYNDTPKDDRGSITIDSPISDSTFKLECQEFKPGLVRCENKDDDIHIYIGN